jgi:hypothetical protein
MRLQAPWPRPVAAKSGCWLLLGLSAGSLTPGTFVRSAGVLFSGTPWCSEQQLLGNQDTGKQGSDVVVNHPASPCIHAAAAAC